MILTARKHNEKKRDTETEKSSYHKTQRFCDSMYCHCSIHCILQSLPSNHYNGLRRTIQYMCCPASRQQQWTAGPAELGNPCFVKGFYVRTWTFCECQTFHQMGHFQISYIKLSLANKVRVGIDCAKPKNFHTMTHLKSDFSISQYKHQLSYLRCEKQKQTTTKFFKNMTQNISHKAAVPPRV